MRIGNEQRATVFDPKEAEKRKHTVVATLSTYEGKDMGGAPIFSSWWTNFVGQAYEKAQQLQSKDSIVITNAKVENYYDKAKEKLYVTITVFDFEKAEDKNQ